MSRAWRAIEWRQPPPSHTFVLCCVAGDSESVWIGRWFDGEKRKRDGYFVVHGGGRATHWKPMPTAARLKRRTR